MTEKTLRRYAITGGIGSGKSTVAAMFARLGAVIIDADAISRDLMRPTENTLSAVVAEFGPDILHPDGTLNRPALAALVFSDEDARTRLNNIVHPAVRARADALVEQAWRAPGFSGIIIDDIPLLAETNRAAEFDGVIVVRTSLEKRLSRLTETRGMAEEDARARIAAQATDAQRAAIATWIIDNDGSAENTQTQVERIWALMTNH
ncbi:dephospho-CoA kinase [Rothia aeria]|uniref:dephospho-CoA kinase n=1 Tax=Rothia aeria TaxID=172042 RepID=UPI00241FCF4B|nr:dephospho-CoA kinase [Rothia aeria]